MALRVGGPSPEIKYGFEMAAEVPDSTSTTTPVLIGQIFELIGTDDEGGGYKLAEATAGDTTDDTQLVQALKGSTVDGDKIAVKVLRNSGIRLIPYKSGSAPTLGQSIAIAAADVRHVAGTTFNPAKGQVLWVDTTNLLVEVLT